MRRTTLFFAALASLSISAQTIQHELVKENLQLFPESTQADVIQKINSVDNFDDFQSSYDDTRKNEGFIKHEKIYKYSNPLEEVWSVYRTADPEQMWPGPKVTFAFMYNDKSKEILFKGNGDIPMLQEGMVIFNHLKIFGVAKMNVAFKITKVDPENKIIKFSYLKCNKAMGVQTLKFTREDGMTVITHTSEFKNDTKFRDRLYPVGHTVAINDHHKNMAVVLADLAGASSVDKEQNAHEKAHEQHLQITNDTFIHKNKVYRQAY